jgi:hypothetical protein
MSRVFLDWEVVWDARWSATTGLRRVVQSIDTP